MTNKVALIVAVVLGVFSILLVKRYIDRLQADFTRGEQPQMLLVARQEIAAGEELTDDMVERRPFASRFVQSVETGIPDTNLKNYIGQKFVADVKAGQILQRLHFRDVESPYDPVNVEIGWRAVTIPVDQVTGLAAMLRPGDYVDVFGFFEITVEGRNQPIQMSVLLERRLLILAIDNITDAGGRYVRGYRTITLRAKPQQVPLVIQAANRGKLHLIKMNEIESSSDAVQVKPVDTDMLYQKILGGR